MPGPLSGKNRRGGARPGFGPHPRRGGRSATDAAHPDPRHGPQAARTGFRPSGPEPNTTLATMTFQELNLTEPLLRAVYDRPGSVTGGEIRVSEDNLASVRAEAEAQGDIWSRELVQRMESATTEFVPMSDTRRSLICSDA